MAIKKGFKVMFVDDDLDVLYLYERFLKKSNKINVKGIDLEFSSNYKDALSKAKDFNPHLMFIDYHLNSDDGVLLAKELSEQLELPPVIYLLSGFPFKEFKKDEMKHSADLYDWAVTEKHMRDFIQKTVNWDPLIDKITTAIQKEATLRILFIDTPRVDYERTFKNSNIFVLYEDNYKTALRKAEKFNPHLVFARYGLIKEKPIGDFIKRIYKNCNPYNLYLIALKNYDDLSVKLSDSTQQGKIEKVFKYDRDFFKSIKSEIKEAISDLNE